MLRLIEKTLEGILVACIVGCGSPYINRLNHNVHYSDVPPNSSYSIDDIDLNASIERAIVALEPIIENPGCVLGSKETNVEFRNPPCWEPSLGRNVAGVTYADDKIVICNPKALAHEICHVIMWRAYGPSAYRDHYLFKSLLDGCK